MKTNMELANEANLPACQYTHPKAIERFAELVRADEREACAKVCEPSEEHRREASCGYLGGEEGVELLDANAAAIRARGNT